MQERPDVIMVTFPRSGHHALLEFLDRVSTYTDEYCEYYQCVDFARKPLGCPKSNLSWRDKGLSCGKGRRILKNHDFDLTLPYDPSKLFVVQYRHPFLSIESWYERKAKNREGFARETAFEEFFEEKLLFWEAFVDKWLLDSAKSANTLPVYYEDLRNPATLSRVLLFAGFENCRVPAIGEDYFVSKRKMIRGDPGVLARKEQRLHATFEKLGIAPIYP